MNEGSNGGHVVPPAAAETAYIRALSRPSVVEAYAQWDQLSDAEEWLLTRYASGAQLHVVDLGCGTGRALACAELELGSYLGVDVSEEMIAEARRLFPAHRFELSDITELQIETDSADVVLLMHNVLDMLQPQQRRGIVLHEAARILKPGGVAIASSHLTKQGQNEGYYDENYHGELVSIYRTTLASWVHEMETAGLEVEIAMRDRRGDVADWAYIAGRNPMT